MIPAVSVAGYRLGVDFGTSHTVAALLGPDARVRPLLFDGSPLLASAVFAGPGSGVLVGADALRAALGCPSGLEPHPKRRIDDGTVWLGERELPVVDLVAAVLARVAAEAERVAGEAVEAVLTHPATWGPTRRGLLADAARQAGFGAVRLVAEPVAAAAYFTAVLGWRIPADRCVVVYDLGAGTFDVSVVRPLSDDFDVVATGGLPDVGGLDLDAMVVRHARTLTAGATASWRRLDWPQAALADQQARHALWQAARAVKEQLSRHATGELYLPLVDRLVHLTREEFTEAARPLLYRTATYTLRLLSEAGVPPEEVAGVFLVGGSSRVPLVATLLHRTLRIAPTVLDQPELVVAEGALHARHATTPPESPALAHPAAPQHAIAPREKPVLTDPPPAPLVSAPPAAPGLTHAASSKQAAAPRETPELTDPAALRQADTPPVSAAPTGVAPPDTATPALTRPSAPERATAPREAPAPISTATHSDTGPPTAPGRGTTLAARPAATSLLATTRLRSRRAFVAMVTACLVLASATVLAIVLRPWQQSTAGKLSATTGHPKTTTALPAPTTQAPAPAASLATLAAHGDNVYAVAFSPNSAILASGSGDRTVRLWDVARGQSIGGPLTGHTEWVRAVAFSPNGAMLATGSDDETARLWDVARRKSVATLTGHRDFVFSVAFSPDGAILATGGGTTVRLWDVARRRLLATLAGHQDTVFSVAFSPDGAILATASWDKTVRLWDVARRRHLATLTGHTSSVHGVAFSPDGKLVASVGSDRTVRLWDVARRRLAATLTGHGGAALKVAFSPDGATLATVGGGGEVRLWDVARRRSRATLYSHRRYAETVAFSPNGTTLATGGDDNTVRLWRLG
jgi:WD40 repeat protein